ncbi:hypothetical protein ACQR16_29575 [Bradyrhizobium oligotrophicum]|uniref:hypothetical protein n=1 Tax=Bradyrhizobium oligotrophicum TaxID=44255 RepID=UPI003EB8C49A
MLVASQQNAVTVHSMWLPAQDSMGEVGLEVQFAKDSGARESTAGWSSSAVLGQPRPLSMTLTARRAIAIAAWSFGPKWFDLCQRQEIQVSAPLGVMLVVNRQVRLRDR